MKYIILLLAMPICFQLSAQEYEVITLGFYNLENLFDTLDQADVRDEEFTPKGSKVWNTDKYHKKLKNLATVISQIGTELDNDGIDILGVSEIENASVLYDLILEDDIKDRHYQVIHGDSRDRRGVDVALLFNPRYFLPDSFEMLEVELYNDNAERYYTRDVLYVFGKLKNDPIHIFVNHWPSRRGGEVKSSPLREKAASVVKRKSIQIFEVDSDAKIFIVGDFNDDPTSPSIANVIGAKQTKKETQSSEFYNTHANFYHRGIGSNAYRDAWNLFDQVIISEGVLNPTDGYKFHQSGIFKKNFMLQPTGNFKGYPFRTFAGDNFLNGYSDHFPSYIYLVKSKE